MTYTKMIQETVAKSGRLDRTDEATAVWIEDFMRDNRSGLDHLTRAQFDAEALECLATIDSPAGRQLVRDTADVFGLPIPEWV